jgi:hypothetical protein
MRSTVRSVTPSPRKTKGSSIVFLRVAPIRVGSRNMEIEPVNDGLAAKSSDIHWAYGGG